MEGTASSCTGCTFLRPLIQPEICFSVYYQMCSLNTVQLCMLWLEDLCKCPNQIFIILEVLGKNVQRVPGHLRSLALEQRSFEL